MAKRQSKTKVTIDRVALADRSDDRDAAVVDVFLDTPTNDPAEASFMAGLAAYSLVDLERKIIGLEFYLAHNPANEISNEERVTRYRHEHQALYDRLVAHLGDNFQPLYQEVLTSHNECARANLDSCDGRLFAYVLPQFNPDGTHEPWGEKDVPWNQKT